MVAEKGEVNINKGLHKNERLSEFREGKHKVQNKFSYKWYILNSELGVVLLFVANVCLMLKH